MLLVGMAILVRKLWKLQNPPHPFLEQDPVLRQVKGMKARINNYSGDAGDQNSTVFFTNRESQDVLVY